MLVVVNRITKEILAPITWNLRVMQVGVENITVRFHCKQTSMKNITVIDERTVGPHFFEKVL